MNSDVRHALLTIYYQARISTGREDVGKYFLPWPGVKNVITSK